MWRWPSCTALSWLWIRCGVEAALLLKCGVVAGRVPWPLSPAEQEGSGPVYKAGREAGVSVQALPGASMLWVPLLLAPPLKQSNSV